MITLGVGLIRTGTAVTSVHGVADLH